MTKFLTCWKEYLSGMYHYFSFEIYPAEYVPCACPCPCYKIVLKELKAPQGSPEATVNY